MQVNVKMVKYLCASLEMQVYIARLDRLSDLHFSALNVEVWDYLMLKKRLYIQKWRWFHPTAFARFDELLQNECLSLDELMSRQEMARRKIVKAAFEGTSFYRKHYSAAGFEIGDIGKDGWFEKLPILTKQHVRDKFEELTNPSLLKYRGVSTTGGSTGVPTRVGVDRRIPNEIYSWRLQHWFGVNPWDDHAYIWRMRHGSAWGRFVNTMLWWPTRHLKMNANMTPELMRQFIRSYNRLRPKLLQGYVGSIVELSRFVLREKLDVHSPVFVWTTSSPLSIVERHLIEEAFHAPVCDQYGSCEIGWYAQQCAECGGLHVNVEHVNIEYVDISNKPVVAGDYGRALVTNLEDEVFPLIRYENGDRGRWLSYACSCGRSLPMIDSVKGRITEHFVLPSGKIINEIFLTTIFDSNPDVVNGFRVIQHKDKSITLEYVPCGFDIDHIRKVLSGFEAAVANEVPIHYVEVQTIQHDRGKQRYVIRE